MRKKVTIHLFPSGRLGNQLYFACMALAARQKLTELSFDVRIVLHSKEPIPALKFLINFEIEHHSSDRMMHIIVGKRTLSHSNIFIRAFFKLFQLRYSIASQSLNKFDELLPNPRKKRIIINQSSHDFRFFECVQQAVNKHQEEAFIDLLNHSLVKEINFDEVVAIHMRFGDYLEAATAANYGNLSENYYQRALLAVAGSSPIKSIQIQLFSDEPEKGIKLLAEMGLENVSYLPAGAFSAADELVIMSKFRRIILSNSTFSWWAGYFASKNSLVVAPNPLMLIAESHLSRSPNWTYVDGWS